MLLLILHFYVSIVFAKTILNLDRKPSVQIMNCRAKAFSTISFRNSFQHSILIGS